MTTTRRPPTARVSASADHSLRLSLNDVRHGWVLVRAHGELDVGTVDALRTVLDSAGGSTPPSARGPGHVVCDLSGVTFLAAAGVGALVEAGDAARRRGAHLHLVATSRPVLRVLELCGLDQELLIVPRLADALDHPADPGQVERARAIAETQLRALRERAGLEQAVGIVAQVGGTSVNEALDRLRDHAGRHRFVLTELASDVVAGRVDPESVARGPVAPPHGAARQDRDRGV